MIKLATIEVAALTKTFGSHVPVDRLSFKFGEGEVFGLLCPNGAGKTTTIRMLAGLISSSKGWAKVKGFKEARQISLILLIPILALMFGQISGVIIFGPGIIAILTGSSLS